MTQGQASPHNLCLLRWVRPPSLAGSIPQRFWVGREATRANHEGSRAKSGPRAGSGGQPARRRGLGVALLTPSNNLPLNTVG